MSDAPLNRELARRATIAGQIILGKFGVIADGRWGRYTQAAYDSAGVIDRERVYTATTKIGAGYTPVALFNHYLQTTRKSTSLSANYIDVDKAEGLARRAAKVVGLDPDPVIDMLDFEPSKKVIDGEMHYDTRSVSPNGAFRGLYQMGQTAWADALRLVPQIGDYAINVFDPWLNTLAAVAFAKGNVAELRRRAPHIPVTGGVMYAMHNQGVSGFLRVVSGGKIRGKQSGAAVASIQRATGDRKSVV